MSDKKQDDMSGCFPALLILCGIVFFFIDFGGAKSSEAEYRIEEKRMVPHAFFLCPGEWEVIVIYNDKPYSASLDRKTWDALKAGDPIKLNRETSLISHCSVLTFSKPK